MNLHFSKTSCRYFDELSTMLLALATNSFAFYSHLRNASHLFHSSHLIWLQGLPSITKTEIGYHPLPLVVGYANNQPPQTIDLLEAPLGTNTVSNPVDVHTLAGPSERIVAGLYIGYFERLLPNVKVKYGPSNNTWPDVWDFGRVVRNAFAHGGVITFENLKASQVNWRGSVISPRDNGNQIFYNYLAFSEIILLLQDLDEAI